MAHAVDGTGDVTPETIDMFRQEFRAQLLHADAKDLMLEAAVNSRVAVRVLYTVVIPRQKKQDQDYAVLTKVLTVWSIVGPVVAGLVGGLAGFLAS